MHGGVLFHLSTVHLISIIKVLSPPASCVLEMPASIWLGRMAAAELSAEPSLRFQAKSHMGTGIFTRVRLGPWPLFLIFVACLRIVPDLKGD